MVVYCRMDIFTGVSVRHFFFLLLLKLRNNDDIIAENIYLKKDVQSIVVLAKGFVRMLMSPFRVLKRKGEDI